MSFRFPLMTVLRVRVLHEEREEIVLQSILQNISHTKRSMVMIETELRKVRADTSSAVKTYGWELRLSDQDAKQIEVCLRELEQQLEKLEQLKDAQIVRYQVARRERELMEEICKKQREARLRKIAKRDQSIMDNIFAARRTLR